MSARKEQTRRFISGQGWIAAEPCPDCHHTKCSEECVCDCRAARAEVDADEARGALRRLVDSIDFDIDGARIHPDPGCLECTSGATPDRLNTGPCGYHAAVAVLARAKP